MFDFLRRSFGSSSRPSLGAIQFDTVGFVDKGEVQPGSFRVWQTPEGDGLGLHFFAIPPNLPANAQSANDLAEYYHRLVAGAGGRLVELSVVTAGGCPAIWTISSMPQEPSGRTYIGALTVPFRDFSFVVRCQCAEAGPTGFKAAVLVDRVIATKDPMQTGEEWVFPPDWNPDEEQYDDEFPNHPVARARRMMSHVASTLRVAPPIVNLPRFRLPQ